MYFMPLRHVRREYVKFALVLFGFSLSCALHVQNLDDSEQTHAESSQIDHGVTCSGSVACQTGAIISGVLSSNEFQRGDGCGSEMPESARGVAHDGLSALAIEVCSGKTGSEDAHGILYMLQNATSAGKPVQRTFPTSSCPDIAEYLDDINSCLQVAKADDGESKYKLASSTKKADELVTKYTERRKLSPAPACDLFAWLAYALLKPFNWCGVNSPEADIEKFITPNMSFGTCDASSPGASSVGVCGKEYVICSPLDELCLKHDFARTGAYLCPFGKFYVPVQTCKANHELALGYFDALMNAGNFLGAMSFGKCAMFLPCVNWIDDPGLFSPITFAWALGEKYLKCPPDGCFQYDSCEEGYQGAI